ncbi:hypothetical protein B0H14DRAFT_3763363 [Mycena olivaceomarginata]|nr:hypothetical protein B0H14DRAFT_3763363 [Mycena olivaceomarginata]
MRFSSTVITASTLFFTFTGGAVCAPAPALLPRYSVNTTVPNPCMPQAVSPRNQEDIFFGFVNSFYITKDYQEAYTHVAGNLINHNPTSVDGIASSFSVVNSLFTSPSVSIQLIHQVFGAPFGWVHYRVDGLNPLPTAFVDVWRMDGRALRSTGDIALTLDRPNFSLSSPSIKDCRSDGDLGTLRLVCKVGKVLEYMAELDSSSSSSSSRGNSSPKTKNTALTSKYFSRVRRLALNPIPNSAGSAQNFARVLVSHHQWDDAGPGRSTEIADYLDMFWTRHEAEKAEAAENLLRLKEERKALRSRKREERSGNDPTGASCGKGQAHTVRELRPCTIPEDENAPTAVINRVYADGDCPTGPLRSEGAKIVRDADDNNNDSAVHSFNHHRLDGGTQTDTSYVHTESGSALSPPFLGSLFVASSASAPPSTPGEVNLVATAACQSCEIMTNLREFNCAAHISEEEDYKGNGRKKNKCSACPHEPTT